MPHWRRRTDAEVAGKTELGLSKRRTHRRVERLLHTRNWGQMTTRKKKTKKPAEKGRIAAQNARKKGNSDHGGHPGVWFEKLVNVQARLRAPDGCPWDREQTHQTLRTYLIEEAYEVLDALESGNSAKFSEELGDLLLQIVFHSQIAREEGRFTISDVVREIHDKMVRRHPHVFGEKRARDSAEVLRNWEQLKAEERKQQKMEEGQGQTNSPSLLDGISRALPATLEGFQLTRRAARIGFDWESAQGVLDKVREETAELERLLADEGQRSPSAAAPSAEQDLALREEEVGDLLFAAVNLARFLHIDPEIALKRANQKFANRFRTMECRAAKSGEGLAKTPRGQMEALWNEVKQDELRAAEAAASGAATRR
jgi:tetrapyrrole methylase family protein/MazG family protein